MLEILSKVSTYHVTEYHFCELLMPFHNQVQIAEFFHGSFHSLSASIIHPLESAILKMLPLVESYPEWSRTYKIFDVSTILHMTVRDGYVYKFEFTKQQKRKRV